MMAVRWLWLMALDAYGHPQIDMPKAQRAVLDKIKWPRLNGVV